MPGQHAHEFPTLHFRVWPTFDNFHSIIFVRLLIIIVSITHRAPPNIFLIKRVPDLPLHFNAERLRRFCAGHDSDQSSFQCSTLCFSILNLKFALHVSHQDTGIMPMAQPVPSHAELSLSELLDVGVQIYSDHLRPATPMTEPIDREVLFAFRSTHAEVVRPSFREVHWLCS
jgi:hypothetical protein